MTGGIWIHILDNYGRTISGDSSHADSVYYTLLTEAIG